MTTQKFEVFIKLEPCIILKLFLKFSNSAIPEPEYSYELYSYKNCAFLRVSYDDSKEEYIDTNYIMALLASGADLNSVDDYGQTVLHAAARDWNPDVARFLIDHGADINKADNYGRTPIFTAILLDYPEMIEFLASKGGTSTSANVQTRTYIHVHEHVHVRFDARPFRI